MNLFSSFCPWIPASFHKRMPTRILYGYPWSLLNFIVIMPPTLKKWGTHWFRLVRVCACMGYRDIVLKLHVWIPHVKIADAYFWFSLNYLPLLNYGPLTNNYINVINSLPMHHRLAAFIFILYSVPMQYIL